MVRRSLGHSRSGKTYAKIRAAIPAAAATNKEFWTVEAPEKTVDEVAAGVEVVEVALEAGAVVGYIAAGVVAGTETAGTVMVLNRLLVYR